MCAICCAAAPFVMSLRKREVLIAFVAIVGVVVGLAHGWLYSFAALYPGLKPTSFLLVGSGLGTFLLIGLQLGVGSLVLPMNMGANTAAMYEYFFPVAALIVLGLIVCSVFAYKTCHLILIDDEHPFLGLETTAEVLQKEPGSGSASQVRSRWEIWKTLVLPQISIFLCTWLQIGSVSLVMFVPNTDPKAFDMPAVLLWSTSLAAFVGSELQSLISPLEKPVIRTRKF